MGARVRGEELLAPVVVTCAVEDHEVRIGESASVRRAALIFMRIRVRIGDNALNSDLRATQLAGEAAPEVLTSDNMDRTRTGSAWRATRGARQQEKGQHKCESPNPNHYAKVLHKRLAQLFCV